MKERRAVATTHGGDFGDHSCVSLDHPDDALASTPAARPPVVADEGSRGCVKRLGVARHLASRQGNASFLQTDNLLRLLAIRAQKRR